LTENNEPINGMLLKKTSNLLKADAKEVSKRLVGSKEPKPHRGGRAPEELSGGERHPLSKGGASKLEKNL